MEYNIPFQSSIQDFFSVCACVQRKQKRQPLEAPFFSKDLILLHIVNTHGNHVPT